MTYIAHFGAWVDQRQDELGRLGAVRFSVTCDDRPNPSAHLVVESDDRYLDLIVWDSGEAESAYGLANEPAVDEHHELDGLLDLDTLLRRLVERMRE